MRPSTVHEEGVKTLDTMASLLGCCERLSKGLPDGRQPDVARLDRRRQILFIGEAKHSEYPESTATKTRLTRYVQWLRAYVSRGRFGIIAICFSRREDAPIWLSAVTSVSSDVGLRVSAFGPQRLGPFLYSVWCVADGRPSYHYRRRAREKSP
jgi:hypothetical protein